MRVCQRFFCIIICNIHLYIKCVNCTLWAAMERSLHEERNSKLQLEGQLLQLEKDHSMLACDYKQAQNKLEKLQTTKDKLTEEVCACVCGVCVRGRGHDPLGHLQTFLPISACLCVCESVCIHPHHFLSLSFSLSFSFSQMLYCFLHVLVVTQPFFDSLAFCPSPQASHLTLLLEQEMQKCRLTQTDLKVKTQQATVLCSSEKQLKQELNHLLDKKHSLEKQNQELRRSG